MKLIIHNSATSVPLDCKRSDHVAAIKARYLDEEGFVGDTGDIHLVFRGRELEDLRQLRDYGIENGSVLAHVPSSSSASSSSSSSSSSDLTTNGTGGAAAPIDYAAVARLLAAAHAHTLGGRTGDPADYSAQPESSDWTTEWTGGDAWRGYPLVMTSGGEGAGPLLTREEVVQMTSETPSDEEEEAEASAGGYGRGFLTSAGDEELEAAERELEARYNNNSAKVKGGASSASGSVATGTIDKGEADSTTSVPRSPVSERKAGLPKLTSATATTTTGPTSLSDADIASQRERASIKAALRRVREARRARQAIVMRGHPAGESVVPFGEGAGKGGGIHVARPTRVFRQLYLAQVGRFAFRTLHRLEGRWVGDAEAHVTGRLSALPDVRVVSTTLSFDDLTGVWREKQSLTSRDGMVTSQTLTLTPIADGLCAVELEAGGGGGGGGGSHHHHHTAEGHHGHGHRGGGGGAGGGEHSTYASSAADRQAAGKRGQAAAAGGGGGATGGGSGGIEAALLRHRPHEMTLQELSDSVLVLTATSRASGRPVMIETITLLSDMQRVRTVQRFDEGAGTFACLYMIRETRILDAVTGAVMEPSRHAVAAAAMQHHQAGGGGRASSGTTTTTSGGRNIRSSSGGGAAAEREGRGSSSSNGDASSTEVLLSPSRAVKPAAVAVAAAGGGGAGTPTRAKAADVTTGSSPAAALNRV